MFFKKRLIILFVCLFLMSIVEGQTTNTGTWNIGDFYYKPNNQFTLWMEVQTRSQNIFSVFFYHQYKGGLFYHFSKTHSSVFFGGCRYTTYNYKANFKSPILTDEFRIWEQLILNNAYHHFNVEHRYRLEQRWVNNIFRPCLRYRLNPTYPINHSSIVPNTLFISVSDEVFLGNNNPRLERNRYYIGLGYQFSPLFTLQMGLLNQTDFNSKGGQTDKNYIQTTLVFSTNKSLFKKESNSSSIME